MCQIQIPEQVTPLKRIRKVKIKILLSFSSQHYMKGGGKGRNNKIFTETTVNPESFRSI